MKCLAKITLGEGSGIDPDEARGRAQSHPIPFLSFSVYRHMTASMQKWFIGQSLHYIDIYASREQLSLVWHVRVQQERMASFPASHSQHSREVRHYSLIPLGGVQQGSKILFPHPTGEYSREVRHYSLIPLGGVQQGSKALSPHPTEEYSREVRHYSLVPLGGIQ